MNRYYATLERNRRNRRPEKLRKAVRTKLGLLHLQYRGRAKLN